MHPAQLRVLPYARSAPDRNKVRSHAPVKEHCTRSERVQCLLMGCTAPSVTSKNTELPEWRTPKDPQGLALVPGGGGRAWPGFETTRRAKLAARTASGRAAAPRHQHADKQENTSSADGKQAAHGADGKQAGLAGGSRRRRRAGSSRSGRRVGGPSGRLAAQTPSRQLAARTPSGRAEWAGRAGGPPPPGTNTQNTRIQRGRDPPRHTAQGTPAS